MLLVTVKRIEIINNLIFFYTIYINKTSIQLGDNSKRTCFRINFLQLLHFQRSLLHSTFLYVEVLLNVFTSTFVFYLAFSDTI